jgi:hypothetical protein
MSIWQSTVDVGTTGDFPLTFDGTVRTYADGWSNHYPTDDVELPAAVGLAQLAPHCVPGHLDDAYDEDGPNGRPGPWLCMHMITQSRRRAAGAPRSIDGSTVLLNPDAARALAAALTAWADGGHTMPIEGEAP